MITIQNQNFGVEIELTGITRQAAAQVIADYYGTIGTRFMGTVYKTYEAVDNKGRRWKCIAGLSIAFSSDVNAVFKFLVGHGLSLLSVKICIKNRQPCRSGWVADFLLSCRPTLAL